MSAFLVEDKTINKIATKVYLGRDFEFVQEQLKDLNIRTPEELGKALFKLNCDSLNGRYGSAEGFRSMNYRYSLEGNHTMLSVFKSLESLIYQCSEDGAIDQKLYKFLEGLALVMAKRIIWDLPEYKNSRWD